MLNQNKRGKWKPVIAFLGLVDPAGTPIPIVPSKTERMHPDDPNLTVLAMFYPSDYFTPHGSHTFLVDADFVMSWANAG